MKHIGEEQAVINAIKPTLPNVEMASWQTSFPELQQALNTKGRAMDIFSIILLGIVGIGILNLLLMAVHERTREIGVLGAIGLRPGQISVLFLLEGAMMGLVGLAFGVAIGILTNFLLGKVGIDYTAFASMTSYTALISGRIYSTLGMEKLVFRALLVLIISFIFSWYPAAQAANNEPARSLHYV